MHLASLVFVVLSLCFVATTIHAASDPRQRFEGLIGKTVQVAWRKIDQEGKFLSMLNTGISWGFF